MRLYNNVKNVILNVINAKNKKDIFHEGFEIGIFIKGIDGILEIMGAFILAFMNPDRLNRIIVLFTQHELAEDPSDFFVRYILKLSHEFSVSAQYFACFYLISHGIIKVFLVAMLQKKKLWSYPLAIIFLVMFIVYQCYRYTYSHSIWLILLTIFDAFMIVLTIIEYKRIKGYIGKTVN